MRRSPLFAIVLISTGLTLVATVILPIAYSTIRFRFFSPPKLIDPTATSGLRYPRILNALGISTVDYAQAANWFETPLPPPVETDVSYFTLSIPSLNLINVPVEVNGTDLKKNAIHYPGSALPGTSGNTVIFGHSALPQFYTKDNPLTVFNPVIRIQPGAQVVINFDGVTYKYQVTKTEEIQPSQVEVLVQKPDRKDLTLITCVPLGTYWRRFVAYAQLISS